MTPRIAGTVGALMLAVAVGAGAFGAHMLEGLVSEARLRTFETAVRYQAWHGLGMLAAAALGPSAARAASWLVAGSVIFSGSLYLLVLTGASFLGAVAPIGGALQIVGWLLLAWSIWQGSRSSD